MEILFNNEKPFQRGMFMGIESVLKDGKPLTLIKVGELNNRKEAKVYQPDVEELKQLASLFTHLANNQQCLLQLGQPSLNIEEVKSIE
jgi:hypothetical protein|nr:MAG TPA: hypothetical protein [Caudoviricetes sp.]